MSLWVVYLWIITRVPASDLAIVLEGLSVAPFEPIETVKEKFLTLKTAFFYP